MDIDKIIDIVHSLKEDAMVVSSGIPTNRTGPEVPGTSPGETPPVFKKGRYRNNYAKGGRGSRRWWLQFLKGK